MSAAARTPHRPAARRIAPVLGLLFLAPWVGEYLLGNISIRDLPALPFLAPLYGGGALLIREVTRRTGRGWPTILLLGAAYGVIEAGLVDQSLFNPSFEGHDFQTVTPIPVLGISAYNSFAFVVGHAVWSIAIPIAIIELLTPGGRSTPWLGRFGLAVTTGLYALGCWIIFQDLRDSEDFLASRAQLAGAALLALALIVTAFPLRRPAADQPAADQPAADQPAVDQPAVDRQQTDDHQQTDDRRGPRPWVLGVTTFVATGIFFARPENWFGVVFGVLFVAVAAPVVARLASRPWWTRRHHFALVAGVFLTYAWVGFVLTAIMESHDPVRWIGNVVFAVAAVLLLVATARRVPLSGRPAPASVADSAR